MIPAVQPEVRRTLLLVFFFINNMHCLQYFHSKNIIVIHPGSLNLRIGRASDLNPVTVLHAIARRRYMNGHKYHDAFLPARVEVAVYFNYSRFL